MKRDDPRLETQWMALTSFGGHSQAVRIPAEMGRVLSWTRDKKIRVELSDDGKTLTLTQP